GEKKPGRRRPGFGDRLTPTRRTTERRASALSVRLSKHRDCRRYSTTTSSGHEPSVLAFRRSGTLQLGDQPAGQLGGGEPEESRVEVTIDADAGDVVGQARERQAPPVEKREA